MHKPLPDISFVQADPSNFRSIVQKLTGAAAVDPPAQKPFIIKKPAFKLQDRRRSAKKLRLKLVNADTNSSPSVVPLRQRGLLVSPVSPLDTWSGRTPPSPGQDPGVDEEEAGFCLNRHRLSTPRGTDKPLLLPLFPVLSPRDDEKHER